METFREILATIIVFCLTGVAVIASGALCMIAYQQIKAMM